MDPQFLSWLAQQIHQKFGPQMQRTGSFYKGHAMNRMRDAGQFWENGWNINKNRTRALFEDAYNLNRSNFMNTMRDAGDFYGDMYDLNKRKRGDEQLV